MVETAIFFDSRRQAPPSADARVSGAARHVPGRTNLPTVSVFRTSRIEDVEAAWRDLEAGGIESPGQSFDFIRLWAGIHAIPSKDQLYLVGIMDGAPVALIALRRWARKGIRMWSWFPGTHIGCCAPLVDHARFDVMTSEARAALWQEMFAGLEGADLIYLRAVPDDGKTSFSELGMGVPAETLYRASFDTWAECNATQRSKSRRKHDRQQGEKLEALGEIGFEVIESGNPEAPATVNIMFGQRAKRFAAMGVADPFAPSKVARFYAEAVAGRSGVATRLHVLRLDGEVVAVRYNIAFGERLFCLISSMSDDPDIRVGSPGKQCLLRVMQTVFDEGYRVFDMGAGLTDEKRHWCNQLVPIQHHYVPLTLRGHAAAMLHRRWQMARTYIKTNAKLLGAAKALRGLVFRSH